MRQVLQQGLLPCGGGRTVGTKNKLMEVAAFGGGPGLMDPMRGYGNHPLGSVSGGECLDNQ